MRFGGILSILKVSCSILKFQQPQLRNIIKFHKSLVFFRMFSDQGTPQQVISGMQVAQRDIQATC